MKYGESMITNFYPVVTVENEDELMVLTQYCDEYKIDFQFLDDNLNAFPEQVLIYIDEQDFELFLNKAD
jgi:hypothetical protein